jgi:hypothetical protein
MYRWQGSTFLDGEQWANCLDVSDTRRFVAFVTRAWKENWPIPRLKKLFRVEVRPPKVGALRFSGLPVVAGICGTPDQESEPL